MRIVVPDLDLADAVGPLDGAETVVWDGRSDPPGGVDLWVAPYMTHSRAVDRAAELDGLRVVQLQSAGYEGVAEKLPDGVLLCNARGVHDDATAEHAVGLVLASLRGTVEAVRHQAQGRWVRMPGRRSLAGSTVLVLGYGSIGRAVAERLVVMKASVVAVASRPRPGDGVVDVVHGVDDLPTLLPQAHVVVVLVPYSSATAGMVDDAFLRRMSDGALLVNVARGGVVDTGAVLAHAGRLSFALDVTDPEPLPDGHPLWSAPGVLVTPHLAGGTTAMLPRMSALVREQARRLLAGEELLNVVAPAPAG